jgi:hypothetical protein
LDLLFSIPTAGGPRPAVRVHADGDLKPALAALGLDSPRAVLVLVGGAAGLDADGLRRLEPIFADAIVPVAERHGACVLDGGTDAGVMRLMGRAREAVSASFPLVGVLVEALAADLDKHGAAPADEPERLEPRHSHFVLVDGSRWGDESPWLAAAAGIVAGDAPVVTLIVNGGEVAWADAELSIATERALIAVSGSGRAADELSAAVAGESAGERATQLAATGLVTAVPANPEALIGAVEQALGQAR